MLHEQVGFNPAEVDDVMVGKEAPRSGCTAFAVSASRL
jgi:hypothetical protein